MFGLVRVRTDVLRCFECGEWIEVTRSGTLLISQDDVGESQISTVYIYDQGCCSQRAGASEPCEDQLDAEERVTAKQNDKKRATKKRATKRRVPVAA